VEAENDAWLIRVSAPPLVPQCIAKITEACFCHLARSKAKRLTRKVQEDAGAYILTAAASRHKARLFFAFRMEVGKRKARET